MPKGYHHVTRDQRCQITLLKSMNYSLRGIAAQLGLAPSTISRELRRNKGQRGYRVGQAQGLAEERRQRASCRPKKLNETLMAQIRGALQQGWSPEQISGRFQLEGIASISAESIYLMVWKDKRMGGSLYLHLRHKAKPYNKRSAVNAGRGCIPNRVDIDQRPAIVETKQRIGDWEGDTIIGAHQQGVILSLVDRHSKFTVLEKLSSKKADGVVIATTQRLLDLPHAVETITFDNGKEFSQHERITEVLGAGCYFAKPYHSWERGLNEHTNGLVREYIPKKTNIANVSKKVIKAIAKNLNNRPRKVLNYKTPSEVFYSTSSRFIRSVALRP